MVTWLRKLKYSISVKCIAFVLLCVSGILLVNSFVGMVGLRHEESYYETLSFEYDMVETAGYVRDWIVRYSDEDIFDPEKITEEELKNYHGELDPKVGIINDRKAYYDQIQSALKRKIADFDYIAVNMRTGELLSNMEKTNVEQMEEALLSREAYLVGNGVDIVDRSKHLTGRAGYENNYFKGKDFDGQEDYKIIIASADESRPDNTHYKEKTLFDLAKTTEESIYKGFIMGIVLAIFMGIYWICVVGKREHSDKISMRVIDKVPFEVQILLYCGTMMVWIFGCAVWGSALLDSGWYPYINSTAYKVTDNMLLAQTILYLLIAIGVGITIAFGSSFIRHIKNHSMYHYSLTLRGFRWLGRSLMDEKTLPVAAVGVIIAYVIGNGVLTILTLAFLPAILLLFGLNVVVGVGVLKVISDYNKLSKGIEAIAGGNLSTKVELRQALPIMKQTAYSINNVGEGLEEAVEKTIKSERFKTELITNVSHDLKTPLTSIISYIHLLKDEQVENETARGYIEVLDERSNRLKQLVEDLVEASKAATGNVKIDLQVLELQQLVLQEIGEYADRLEEQGLQVISKAEESIKVLGDGRHVWRIVENLLSNVCKYALEGTRVYVDVTKEQDYGKLIIKNISKEQLAISPSELTERFVRGDEARSTEGSGLGLAIAQSLVDVQGGKLKIEIDGDLFKVEIWMPLAK